MLTWTPHLLYRRVSPVAAHGATPCGSRDTRNSRNTVTRADGSEARSQLCLLCSRPSVQPLRLTVRAVGMLLATDSP